jgi:hypothetical protein
METLVNLGDPAFRTEEELQQVLQKISAREGTNFRLFECFSNITLKACYREDAPVNVNAL